MWNSILKLNEYLEICDTFCISRMYLKKVLKRISFSHFRYEKDIHLRNFFVTRSSI